MPPIETDNDETPLPSSEFLPRESDPDPYEYLDDPWNDFDYPWEN